MTPCWIEFNILRKAGRSIMADLITNPVQVDFEPKGDTKDDAAELLDGLYRNDLRNNTSIEAFSNADQENVVCGMGAWLLHTEYETTRGGNRNQVIRRKPILEANNNVFFDPNAKLLDKSDANYCSVLFAYSKDGYLDLVEELTGQRPDNVNPSNFGTPEQSYSFPWILGESEKIYVVEFYHRKKVKKKIVYMVNPFGQEMTLDEESLEKVMDELLDEGYIILSDKTVDRWEVRKYIASGEEILNGEKGEVVAGEHIPVIVEYGESAYVEGEHHYEGVTRLAKDPSRLRNFMMSYLADIGTRSPREKPIFFPEQIAGFEDMYSLSGADNNYPYLLQNRLTANGEQLPIGAVGVIPAPTMPATLGAMVDLTRQAVEDVANAGIQQDVADPDISGKAVLALQARLDMQSLVYQEHRKHALRRDGEIYASMAAVIYDVPRKVKTALPDGTQKESQVLETIVDQQTGEIVTLRDLRNSEFDVFSKISSSYTSQKEKTLDRIDTMVGVMQPTDPMRNILILKSLKLMDGVDFDDVREYANKQLVIMGIRKPETPEEEQLLAQSQQTKEPSAEMVLAQAEMLKGQAAMIAEKRATVQMELDAKNEAMKRSVDSFNAETKRIDSGIKAEVAGADIESKNTDTFAKRMESQAKVIQLRDPVSMTDDELFDELSQLPLTAAG
jgi:Phage P22-like portal protein